MTLRISRLRLLAAGACIGASLSGFSAHAALFSDDEARQAIIDLRREVRERADQQARKLDEELAQSQRSQLQLASQIEQLQQEIARLRGQIEILTKQVADTQQAQKDIYLDIDTRLKRVEPQTASIDGQETTVSAEEKRAYDAAIDIFRNGNYAEAIRALSAFVRQYPQSPYAPAAQFYIGSSHYALKDYKSAIAQQQTMVKNYPNNVRAPDALLVIAGSQVELNDRRGARATLERIIREYPGVPAAQTAKERLELLK
ncbi:tol-pal system protein YbgF [uncultured Pigmentiphaga sp.]|jgi:tol-pal system protein YbgF|uniref:tol-pal system protein YbgF n=3 Tax=Pigmentiphaga TaxID=152267 RepID=UPI0026283335|nr:tol-pal system protein YbgF [uncultured Pigmentiphaga sp.]